MAPFPGEDGILEWTGAFSPDGGTFFEDAITLLSHFAWYNKQGNTCDTTRVLQGTKRLLGHMESYERRWGFPLVYKKTDIDSARRLRDCAVDFQTKIESYPSLRNKDPDYLAALLTALATSMTALVSPVVVCVPSPSSDVTSTQSADTPLARETPRITEMYINTAIKRGGLWACHWP